MGVSVVQRKHASVTIGRRDLNERLLIMVTVFLEHFSGVYISKGTYFHSAIHSTTIQFIYSTNFIHCVSRDAWLFLLLFVTPMYFFQWRHYNSIKSAFNSSIIPSRLYLNGLLPNSLFSKHFHTPWITVCKPHRSHENLFQS